MPITIRQLADLVQGTIVGDGDLMIQSARALHDALPGDISFVESAKFINPFRASAASAAVTPIGLACEGKTAIQVADPLMAFVEIFRFFQGKPKDEPSGVHPRSLIHDSAHIGGEPSIHAFAQVGEGTVIGDRCQLHSGVVIGRNCRLGDDVVLYPNVVIYDDCVLGDRVCVHANSVIGADGFGFRFKNGRHVKVPQLSCVIVGNDVEIGACVTIDRGVFEPTRVGEGTKIDNHVQIAHNCQIGKHNLLAALVGIGGSSKTGDYVTLAGQVGVGDHVTIGAGSIAGGQAGVVCDAPPNSRLLGMPARQAGVQRRIHVTEDKLPEMRRDLQRIKKQLGIAGDAAA